MVYQLFYHIQIAADLLIQHIRLKRSVLKTLRHQAFDGKIKHLTKLYTVCSRRKSGKVHLFVNGVVCVHQDVSFSLDGKKCFAHILRHGSV